MSAKIVQLRIMLQETEPVVWRLVQVPIDTSFRKLHEILNVVMGWEAAHLWCFKVGKKTIGDKKLADQDSWENDTKIRLANVIETAKSFEYEYDFGDRWSHEVVIEEVLVSSPDTIYPLCMAGENACPPEDCGGPGGFENFKEAINDPNHEEQEDMLDWYGKPWKTSEFDVKKVNRRLAALRKSLSVAR